MHFNDFAELEENPFITFGEKKMGKNFLKLRINQKNYPSENLRKIDTNKIKYVSLISPSFKQIHSLILEKKSEKNLFN